MALATAQSPAKQHGPKRFACATVDSVSCEGGGVCVCSIGSGCILAAGLGGCSLYPIPDDVSPFSTEQIVRYGRCEVTYAILEHMLYRNIITLQATDKQIKDRIAAAKKKVKEGKTLDPPDDELLKLSKVAMVYSFDFLITEQNKSVADAGFRLPWLTNNVLDVGATGALDLTRQGSRVFGAEFSWGDLITDSSVCAGKPWQRRDHFVYPLTGSIGVGRVVKHSSISTNKGEPRIILSIR